MPPLHVGIIGAGFVGRAHIEAIRRTGLGTVVAVAQSTAERAQSYARELGIPRAYGDWRELLSDSGVQVVHNCSPNHLHFEINLAAVQAGKAVLSEKPLAMTSSQSQRLAEAAQESGAPNAICFNYRFYPLVQELRNRLASAARIYSVSGGYTQDWLLHATDYNWRLEPELGGNSRAVADIGSHWADLISHVIGRSITEVCADVVTVHTTRYRPSGSDQTFARSAVQGKPFSVGTEDLAHVLIRLDGGVRGSFTVSQVTAGRKNRLFFEVSSSDAAYAWDQEEPNRLWIGHRERANEVLMRDPSLLSESATRLAHYPGGHEEGWPDGLKNLIGTFYRSILSDKRPDPYTSPLSSFADGHRAMLITEAIMKSASASAWVPVAQ